MVEKHGVEYYSQTDEYKEILLKEDLSSKMLALLKEVYDIGYKHYSECHPSEDRCSEECLRKRDLLNRIKLVIDECTD